MIQRTELFMFVCLTGLVTSLAILKTNKLLSNKKYLWKHRHTLLMLVYVSLN